ncbi:MAG: Wzz/FepE/Etk N-terminal domain-containing protein, partial [Pseudomonadota bacterium]
MSQRAPYEDDDLNLRTLFAAMRRNLLKVLVFAVCAGALTYVVLSMVAPRYQSEAQIQIAAKATNPFPQQQGQAAPPDTVAPRLDREAINTHVRALSAPDLLPRLHGLQDVILDRLLRVDAREAGCPHQTIETARRADGRTELGRSRRVQSD